MMTGTLVWLLFRAHRDGLSGALEIRRTPAAEPHARVFLKGRKCVHIEGIDGLLDDLAGQLPSSSALVGALAHDVPVCMALGIGLDAIFEAACAGLGRGLAAMAQDPALHCSFDPDQQPPGGAFPLPKEAIRCFHQGLRGVRDADAVALELRSALDNPIRLTDDDAVEDFGAVVLRTFKLARTEGTLRGLVASSGRGQGDRTREAWFSVDLLMQLGLLQLEGAPVKRSAGWVPPSDARRLSEEIVSAVADGSPPVDAPRRRAPSRPPKLESDDEADDVFEMGADLDEDSIDEDSVDEDSADEPSGATHTISWPGMGADRPRAKPSRPAPTSSPEVQGGLHESDDEASDVFAMGGDEDLEDDDEFEDLDEDSIEYLDEEEEDEDDLFEVLGEPEEDDEDEGDPETFSSLVDVDEDGDFDDGDSIDFEDDLDDDALAETTLDQPSEPPRLRPLPDTPDETSPIDPTETLDHPEAAELVTTFRALRDSNPLAVLGFTLEDAQDYITLPMLRRKAHLASGRWHPERFDDEHEHVQAAAAELSALVERRWAALKDPRILAKAIQEWRMQLPPPVPDPEGMARARQLYGRARQQATANAWTAALLTIGEALEADPSDLKSRLLDLQCRVVLEEFDVDSALANLDALSCRDDREQAEVEHTGGVLLKLAERHEESAERFEWALRHDPKHPSARRELEAVRNEGGAFLKGIFGPK